MVAGLLVTRFIIPRYICNVRVLPQSVLLFVQFINMDLK